MAATDQINNIKSKVSSAINKYGNTLTLRSQGVETKDTWGKPSFSGQVDTITIGVTDNNISANMIMSSGGKLKSGDLTILLKGDEIFDETFDVILNSVTHDIITLELLKAADVIVAYQLVVRSK